MDKERTESLEGRWDILYRDYPEVYDEFASIPKVPDLMDVMVACFPLAGKVVADVGSGTGISTFKLARHAGLVIGVEIEEATIGVARASAKERGVWNVRFGVGDAEHLPLADGSVDAAMAITLAGGDVSKVAAEMERVVRPGGLVLRADVAPGWYGGELGQAITGKPRDEAAPEGSLERLAPGELRGDEPTALVNLQARAHGLPPVDVGAMSDDKLAEHDNALARLGYRALDVFMDQDYGSVERAVRTYGFIHSQRAIDYIREHQVTTIRWKARVRSKTVG